MQLIAADIGNSSIKVAFPSEMAETNGDDRRQYQTTIQRNELIDFELTLEKALWSISSVNQFQCDRLLGWIKKNRPQDRLHLITHDDVPLKTNVKKVSNVGVDRLVAAAMAVQLNDGGGPVVVIDAGTAVTIDVVDENNIFCGGVIFPGATTNLVQLAETTSKLPDLSAPDHLQLLNDLATHPIGDDTIPAIIKGVYGTQIAGINTISDSLRRKWNVPASSVYATGGGVTPISMFLDSQWNMIPDLVLRGAREIGNRLMKKKTDGTSE